MWYVVFSPTNPNSETQSRDLQEVARKLALQLHTLRASAERDLDTVFVTVAQLRAGALLIGGDAFFASRSGQIAAPATRHAIPTISFMRSFAAAGGLMSYGGSLTDADRLLGVHTGRILKGEKPADLPVQQSTVLFNSPLRSFNHLIGTDEQIGRHSEPKHLRGLKIDDQLDLRALSEGHGTEPMKLSMSEAGTKRTCHPV